MVSDLLVLYSEYLSLDPQILTRQQHDVQQSVILAQLFLGSVRRRDGIRGANRVLPWTQNCGLGRRKDFASDPTSPRLYQYLVQFFQRTRRAALSNEDINVVRQTFDFNLSNFTVRGWYAAVLNDFRLSYLRGSTQRSSIPEVCFYDSRLLANACADVVKYISRMGLYSRTSDGTYIFDMRRFDWTLASCLAKLEAHDDEKHLYTPKFLQTMFFGKELECQSAPRGQFGLHATSIGLKLQIRQNFEFFLGYGKEAYQVDFEVPMITMPFPLARRLRTICQRHVYLHIDSHHDWQKNHHRIPFEEKFQIAEKVKERLKNDVLSKFNKLNFHLHTSFWKADLVDHCIFHHVRMACTLCNKTKFADRQAWDEWGKLNDWGFLEIPKEPIAMGAIDNPSDHEDPEFPDSPNDSLECIDLLQRLSILAKGSPQICGAQNSSESSSEHSQEYPRAYFKFLHGQFQVKTLFSIRQSLKELNPDSRQGARSKEHMPASQQGQRAKLKANSDKLNPQSSEATETPLEAQETPLQVATQPKKAGERETTNPTETLRET